MLRSCPFPPSTTQPGHGDVHLTLLPPSTPTFSTLTYTYPLKLVASTPHKIEKEDLIAEADPNSCRPLTAVTDASSTHKPIQCLLLFMLSYGGGLLAGDTILLKLTLDPYTRLCLTTQGTTKVFKAIRVGATSSSAHASSRPSTQTLRANLATNSALWLAPDPVQPFKDSLYEQIQIFHVSPSASLGFVDWVLEGRKARRETWSLQSWKGRNEVWTTGHDDDQDGTTKSRMLVRDAIILDGAKMRAQIESDMTGTMGLFGTVMLHGPLYKSLAAFFVAEFAILPRLGGRNWTRPTSASSVAAEASHPRHIWRQRRLEREKQAGVCWTACHMRECTIVKFTAREGEGARDWLGEMIREEGTIRREFGDGGLMFVK